MPWKGSGPSTSGRGGVDVHLLAEPVRVQQVRAPSSPRAAAAAPAASKESAISSPGRETTNDVVHGRQQLAHVARRACSGPGRPSRASARHAGVVVAERLAAVGRDLGREAALARGRRARLQARRRTGRVPRASHPRLVPVDAHVGDDADAPRRALASGRPSPPPASAAGPTGIADVRDRRLPAPVGVLHLAARGGCMARPAWCAATLSLENA